MDPGDLHDDGVRTMRDVLGDGYVDKLSAAADDFMTVFLDAVTELSFGYSWSRDGLDRRSRFLLTLGILAASGRFDELAIYARGALRRDVTTDELKEIGVHIASYCGTPTSRQSFIAFHKAIAGHAKDS